MATQYVKGRDLMVFKVEGEPQSETYKAFLCAISHNLSLNTEDVDVSNKDTGEWGDSVAGVSTWEITMNCQFVQTDFDELMEAAINKERMKVLFVKKKNAGDPGAMPSNGWEPDTTGGWIGEIEIRSISAAAPHNGVATYDVTMKGCGPLAKRDA